MSVGLVLGASVLLSACTATTALPPRDLASVFTPTAQDQASAPSIETQLQQASEPSLAPQDEASTSSESASSDTATTPAAEPAPNVVAALSPAAGETPSATATQAASSSGTQPALKKPTEVAAAETTQLSAAPKATAKKDGSLFGMFLSSNQSSQSGSVVTTTNRTRSTSQRSPTSRATRPSSGSDNGNLPGVRANSLFGVSSGSAVKRPDEEIVQEDENDQDEEIEVASVANRAVRGNHGLLLQRPDVNVSCFPPRLVSLLRKVERRFGRKVIVTSGFRSRKHNRRIRGARNSTHTSCLAADIQVQGISKWQMAKYLRSLPGRGGVGTYCHTKSVHIDIGKKRSWNYCSRRRGKRRS